MAHPTPSELLLSPWTFVSLIGKMVLVGQAVAVVAGCVPTARRYLSRSPAFVGLLLGTPLYWMLFETSRIMVIACGEISLNWYYLAWVLIRLPFILGYTIVLQSILSIQYGLESRQYFPVPGLLFACVAVLGDSLFLLYFQWEG